MYGPGAVASPGHTKRLSLLPCRAPHNYAYLAQTDGAYSAACGRRVPSRQKSQALSMTSGFLQRPRPVHAAAPPAVLVVHGGRVAGW